MTLYHDLHLTCNKLKSACVIYIINTVSRLSMIYVTNFNTRLCANLHKNWLTTYDVSNNL
jgi:hypothetical protein